MPELPDPKARPHPWDRHGVPVISISLEGGGQGVGEAHELSAAITSASCASPAPSPPHFQGGGNRPSPSFQYVELHVTSNFTFLTGASHPDEMVEQAAALGYRAIAITDRNSLAGIVRGHVAAKETGIAFVVGCRLEIEDGRQFPPPLRVKGWVERTSSKEAHGADCAPPPPPCPHPFREGEK